MIFQPSGGGSGGGLSVVASGETYGTINFDRSAVCVFVSPSELNEGGTSGFCTPGRYVYMKIDDTTTVQIGLTEDGMRMTVYNSKGKDIQYLALG